jgi:uncharacterized membrane protein HdeD (DUF308 family)
MVSSNHLAGSGTPMPADAVSGWNVAWGVLLVIGGVVAVMMPEVAALATTLVFGWVIILCGAFELGYAIQTRRRVGSGWRLTSGILTLLLGLAIVVFPLTGAVSLGLLVGAFLLVGGVTRIALAFQLKPVSGWGWVLFDGVLSIALAILIMIGWPGSSLVVIGVLTGLWLISAGIWRIFLRGPLRGPLRA